METIRNSKYRKLLKDGTYLHCSICGDFQNINAFAHRKSKVHKKRLNSKLRKIAFHLSMKKRKKVVVHDEEWPEKNSNRFCHFCAESYDVHFKDGEFVVEDLGALYHHAGSHHVKSTETFLDRNFSKENPEKYCILKADLDCFLKEVAEAKTKYLKKMQLLDDMFVKQIKTCEEERKKLVYNELQVQPSCSGHETQNLPHKTETRGEAFRYQNVSSNKNKTEVKVPPWLEDVADNSVVDSGNVPAVPIIGPTLDTLMKHVESQKKKGLPQNRVGAHFQHAIQASASWRPSFHGTWNRRRQKEQQRQFKPRNKMIDS